MKIYNRNITNTELIRYRQNFSPYALYGLQRTFFEIQLNDGVGGYTNERASFDTPIPNDEWAFVACTYSKADQQVKTYINGILQADVEATEAYDIHVNGTNLDQLYIGGATSTTDILATPEGVILIAPEGVTLITPRREADAIINEVRIYGTALTSNEVKALYLYPAGNKGARISGNQITTGIIQSTNWAAAAGSKYNLDDGTFYLGGSSSPKLSWDGTSLSVAGAITATSGSLAALSVTGAITISDTGHICTTGKTSYDDTDAGIWMGYDTDAYKLNIGDVTNFLKFDGTDTTGNFSGVVNMAFQGGTNLSKNDAQTITTGTATLIDWETEDWDTQSEFNMTTNKYTIAQDGKLLITAQVCSSGETWAASKEWHIQIWKNGSRIKVGAQTSSGIAAFAMIASCSVAIKLDTNDYIELKVWHNRGVNTGINFTFPGINFACFQKLA